MIQLTKDLVLTADEHCYIVGKPRQRPGRPIGIENAKYYSTVTQAVQGALSIAMRQGVADGSITTLQDFIKRAEVLRDEFAKLVAPLE